MLRALHFVLLCFLAAPAAQAQTPTGDLPPAPKLDAEIYMKYTWTYGSTIRVHQKPLVLFPDGTAFKELPTGVVSTFEPAALRAALIEEDEGEHVGTWRREDDTLILTFEGETRRLPRTERGWWDDDDPPKSDTAYKTYFPIVIAEREDLLGPWISESLFTIGVQGVNFAASGSTANRVFFADGTYTEDEERFVTATGEITGGSYVGFGSNDTSVAGRWRIDGPLMTIEKNGQRGVLLAFILPEWDKKGGDVWIGGNWWDRPDE
ncbi:MAG: hypothetical protein AAF752_11750 [Bacteroidota bacterium]